MRGSPPRRPKPLGSGPAVNPRDEALCPQTINGISPRNTPPAESSPASCGKGRNPRMPDPERHAAARAAGDGGEKKRKGKRTAGHRAFPLSQGGGQRKCCLFKRRIKREGNVIGARPAPRRGNRRAYSSKSSLIGPLPPNRQRSSRQRTPIRAAAQSRRIPLIFIIPLKQSFIVSGPFLWFVRLGFDAAVGWPHRSGYTALYSAYPRPARATRPTAAIR